MTATHSKRAGCIAVAALMAAACARAEAKPASTAAADPRVVTVVARDFAFTGPDEVPAGMVTFQLQNRGTQLHHMAIMKLDEGKTLGDLLAAFQAGGPPPAWAHDLGGP